MLGQWSLLCFAILHLAAVQAISYNISRVHSGFNHLQPRDYRPSQGLYDFRYKIPIQVGIPRQYDHQRKEMILDTTSSLFVFGGAYMRMPSHQELEKMAFGPYLSGHFTGKGFKDHLWLEDSKMMVYNATVIHATKVPSQFETITSKDGGVMGIGPSALSAGYLEGDAKAVPTIIDLLYAQKRIRRNMFTFLLRPQPDDQGNLNGVFTLGQLPTNEHEIIHSLTRLTMESSFGKVHYYPRYNGTRRDAINHYAIEISNFKHSYYSQLSHQYENERLSGDISVALLDPSADMTLLPEEVFQNYRDRFPGSKTLQNGALVLNEVHLALMGNMTLTIGNEEYTLTKAAQIVPPAVAARLFGVHKPNYMSIFAQIGPDSPFDAVLGHYFLARYMSVYDNTERPGKVGLAETKFSFEDTLNDR